MPAIKEEELLDDVHAIKNTQVEEPSPFHVVRRIITMQYLPWNQKITLRRLNLHSSFNGECVIVPNTPQFNALIAKVKHLLQLKPAKFADGRIPTAEDLGAIKVCPYTGIIRIDEKLRMQANRLNTEKPFLFQGNHLRYKIDQHYQDMEDIFGWCREGNTMQVRIWLDDTTNDMNEGDDHGFSPLHWACFAGRTNIVDMLLNRGARINASNMGDDTALHLAASHGHVDCVNLLLRNKADVNALNEHGNTPLHYACFWGYQEIAEMLLMQGAQANVANVNGDTPIDNCHRHLVGRMTELAVAAKQDLSRKVAYREASQMSGTQTKLRTRNATLSKHPGISLQDLNLTEKTAITTSGETWRGTWNNIDICAKFINYGPECTARIVRDFSEEYPKLRIFSHPNLLPVIGCCNQPPSLVVVTEHMPYGSLYNILHESKSLMVDTQQALKFALDIARGMAFLHSLNPMIPRLFLNSFHVLISDDLSARINMADAKFSFQERNKVYQPAWMAPEALQKKESEINLHAANMWSFAIILWELATRQVPFAGLSAIEIGMKVALEDLRISIPPGLSNHLARLTRICMNEEPGKRPTFDQIIPILTKMAHAK